MPELMHERLLQRTAAAVTRRRSLRALGGAALAAPTVALPDRAAARNRKKKRKRKGKGTVKGPTCEARELQRCTLDAEACKATALAECPAPGTCGFALSCCETCDATGFLACLLGFA